jgi:peptidoglycan/xylan/chitin deacetylase (PgdA/CDA1 family)
MSPAAVEVCATLGVGPVYWSAWGLDWENVSAERIASVVAEKIDDGGIVLLHDSARFARRSSALATAEAIPAIVAEAQARGISLVSLGNAFADREHIAA